MKLDMTKGLWNWLDANATQDTFRNCYGETMNIYHVPHEKMRDFFREYDAALVTEAGKWDAWECSGLKEGDTMECVIGKTEPCDGKYFYHMRGSDYDTGRYEAGPSGVVNCECYLYFDTGTLYFSNSYYQKAPQLSRDRSDNVVVFEKGNVREVA